MAEALLFPDPLELAISAIVSDLEFTDAVISVDPRPDDFKGLYVHVVFAEENLQRFSITRLEELEGVGNGMLGTENANNVAAPCLDLVVGGVDSAGDAVLADVTTLDPFLRELLGNLRRESRTNRGVHDAAGSRYRCTNKNVVERHGSSPFDRVCRPVKGKATNRNRLVA